MKILIYQNNQQSGPFTVEEIRQKLESGALTPNDMAWYEGAAQWAPISTIPGIAAPLPTQSIPPFPPPPQSKPSCPIGVSNFSTGKPSTKLPRIAPVSAWGVFFCGVGAIWTIISLLQLISEINRIRPASNLQIWALFIPIYSNIYISNIIKELNNIISETSSKIPPVVDNMALNFLFPFLPFQDMFNTYNKVADLIENKA